MSTNWLHLLDAGVGTPPFILEGQLVYSSQGNLVVAGAGTYPISGQGIASNFGTLNALGSALSNPLGQQISANSGTLSAIGAANLLPAGQLTTANQGAFLRVGPPYPYDAKMQALGIDYRWGLASGFTDPTSTEANIGDAGTMLLERTDVDTRDPIATTALVRGTQDNGATLTSTTPIRVLNLGANIVVDGSQSFWLGMWLSTAADRSVANHIFGTNQLGAASNYYRGFWGRIETDGLLYLQYGDNTGAVISDRRSYSSASGVLPFDGSTHFLVIYCAPTTIAANAYHRVWVDGVEIATTWTGGSASEIAWPTNTGQYMGFSTSYRTTTAERFVGTLDDIFFHYGDESAISTADIEELYTIGTTA